MPFGPYSDFADCTSDQKRKGHSDESADKICGALQSKLGGSLLEAIDYQECIKQAGEFGHDTEASKRICDSVTGKNDDAEDALDQGIDEQSEGEGQGKAAWYDPSDHGLDSNSGTEDPLEGGDQDSPTIDATGETDAKSTYDLGNDGPNMDNVDPTPDEAGFQPPEAYDVNNPNMDDNDHVDSHMTDGQKATYDYLDDASAVDGAQQSSEDNTRMKDPGMPFNNGITESPAKTDSAQYAPYGASENQKQELVQKYGSFRAAAKNAQIEPFESNGKLFVKAFLLDTSLNQNAWGVSPQTLDANINSYIGKPLVLNDNFDHPDSGDDNLDHQLMYQELYRIGTVIDVVKKGTRYEAISEITDPYAVDAFHHGELPIYVSPQLYKQDPTEPDSSISKWSGTHLAVVKNPAYGVKVAQYKGSCTGEANTCVAYLKKASLIQKNGYGNCGYCNRKILLSAAIPKVNLADAESKVDSSHVQSEEKTDVIDLEGAKDEKSVPASKETATQTAQGKPTLEAVLAENEKLKQKLLVANESIKEHTKVNEGLGQRVASLEQERRKDQISTILSAAEFEQDGFADKVNSLAKSSLPIEDIHSIFKPLVEAKSKVKSAAVQAQAQQEPKTEYVESKVSMKNAAVEPAPNSNSNNGKPAWLITREHLFSGGKL